MSWPTLTSGSSDAGVSVSVEGFLAAVALAILAYKGSITITNSGGEIVDPHRNTGRAIIWSLAMCTAVIPHARGHGRGEPGSA